MNPTLFFSTDCTTNFTKLSDGVDKATKTVIQRINTPLSKIRILLEFLFKMVKTS